MPASILLETCNRTDEASVAVCSAYFMGVLEGMAMERRAVDGKAGVRDASNADAGESRVRHLRQCAQAVGPRRRARSGDDNYLRPAHLPGPRALNYGRTANLGHPQHHRGFIFGRRAVSRARRGDRARSRKLRAERARVLDLGAASSNPDRKRCRPKVEIARLAPVVAALKWMARPISIDSFAPMSSEWAMAQGVSLPERHPGLPLPVLYPELARAQRSSW